MASTAERYNITDQASCRAAIAALRQRCTIERECHSQQGQRLDTTDNLCKATTVVSGLAFMIFVAPRVFAQTPESLTTIGTIMHIGIIGFSVGFPMLRDIFQLGERKIHHISEFNKYNHVLGRLTMLDLHLSRGGDAEIDAIAGEFVRCVNDADWNKHGSRFEIPDSLRERVIADVKKQQ